MPALFRNKRSFLDGRLTVRETICSKIAPMSVPRRIGTVTVLLPLNVAYTFGICAVPPIPLGPGLVANHSTLLPCNLAVLIQCARASGFMATMRTSAQRLLQRALRTADRRAVDQAADSLL